MQATYMVQPESETYFICQTEKSLIWYDTSGATVLEIAVQDTTGVVNQD